MAKLEINKASDDDGGEYVKKSKYEVSKEMNVYWKIQSVVEGLAGPATVEKDLEGQISAPAHLRGPWGKNGEQSGFKIYLPLHRPLYIIVNKG